MKKNLLIKTLAVGIIFLFIGVAVAPSTAVNISSKEDAILVDDTSEDNCDCQSVSDINLIRLDKTLNRLEVYTRLLSLFSKRNPEIAEIYGEISIKVSALREMIKELKFNSLSWDFPIICGILESVWNQLVDIADILNVLIHKYWDNEIILGILVSCIIIPFEIICIIVGILGICFFCDWIPWELPMSTPTLNFHHKYNIEIEQIVSRI